MREHLVRSGEVTLRVREHGEPRPPHVVLVHGYPDDQTLWDPLVPMLAGAHVVTYDVRGMGRSGAPARTAGYRLDRLREDLAAVLDAVLPPGEQAHVVGHDWGSVQLWHCVGEDAGEPLLGRLASFVSASGPSLDQLGAALRRRDGATGSTTSLRTRLGSAGRRRMLRGLRASAYLAAFQLPLLPELMWRSDNAAVRRVLREMARQGAVARWTPGLARSATNGLGLYRANLVPRLARPRARRVRVPVVLVVALRDAYVSRASLEPAARYCASLKRVELVARHWHPRTHPELLAGVLREHLWS